MDLSDELIAETTKRDPIDSEDFFEDDGAGFSDDNSEDFEVESIHDESTVTSARCEDETDIALTRGEPQQFQYSRLEKETQFRLLVLKAWKSSMDDPIKCKLRVEDLDDETCPQFEALSYTWGERNDLFKIWIEDDFIRVTANLRNALQNLRSHDKDRFLWVDAICINQSSELEGRTDKGQLDEKTVQVRRMGSIYEKASSVVIWLGLTKSEDDQLKIGRTKENQFYRFLNTPKEHREQMEFWNLRWANWPSGREEVKEDLKDLLHNDWFERVWIVQEVALSRSAYVQREQYSVPGYVFAQFPRLLGVQPEPHCQQILNIMPGVRTLATPHRTGEDRAGVWLPRELRSLLQDFRHSKSSREEDKIYALLGLSVEQERASGALALDYSKTEHQVVRDTIKTLYPEIPDNDLPTWTLAEFWGNLLELETVLLMRAAAEGQATVFKQLLETTSTGSISLFDDARLRVAFFSALENRHAGVVAVIIETGRLDLNSRSDEGHTPLDIAVQGHDERTFLTLLGANNIDIDDEQVVKELLRWWSFAVAHRKEPSIDNEVIWEKLLTSMIRVGIGKLENLSARPLLTQAIVHSNKVAAKLLLGVGRREAGLEGLAIDSEDRRRRTPLSYAAEYGFSECVKLLLDTGNVNVNSKDRAGRTALNYAASGEHLKTVKMLLEVKEVDVNCADLRGRTPMSYAAEDEEPDTIKLLLETGKVDVNAWDHKGRTPLSYAAEHGTLRVVELLLSIDEIDVDSADHIGRTPLSYAAENYRCKVVKLLLGTSKVNINSEDHTGRTPLSWAASSTWDVSMIENLLDIGRADHNIADREGRTPLSWAQNVGYQEVAELLASKMQPHGKV